MSDTNSGRPNPGDERQRPARVPDRRKFLTGTAAAVAGTAAGLGLSGPAMAAAEATKWYPVPGYPGQKLPFPTNPQDFFLTALRTVYGALQVCLCVTPEGVLRLAGGEQAVANVKGGLAVALPEGKSKQGKNVIEQAINLILNPTDHIADGVGGAMGVLGMRHDGEREAPASNLFPLDPEQAIRKFGEIFLNPFQWPSLAQRFFANPIEFFKAFIGLFFPAKQDMNFNLRVTSSKFENVTLVNKTTVTMENSNAKEFPPRNASYNINKRVELVDEKNPNGQVLVTVEKWGSTVSHKEGAPAELNPQYVSANVSSTVTITGGTTTTTGGTTTTTGGTTTTEGEIETCPPA